MRSLMVVSLLIGTFASSSAFARYEHHRYCACANPALAGPQAGAYYNYAPPGPPYWAYTAYPQQYTGGVGGWW